MVDADQDPVLFARAVEELPDGMLACLGPDHIVMAINRAARAFAGHDPSVVGRTMREALPAEFTQSFVATFDRVLATGRPCRGIGWRVMVDHGDRLAEHFVDHVTLPLRDADECVCGVLSQFRDVTATVLERRAHQARAAGMEQRPAAPPDVVLTLQRSHLPAALPVVPGLRVAARYLVAGQEQAAGGDWFDAVPVDSRMVAVVGDVVGHGAAASAVMGQLRAVLGELLHSGEGLLGALARLDRFAGREPGARGATVCLALVDPSDGAVTYACAGHPPPLVVSPNGTARVLPAPGGGPIGVSGPPPVLGRAVLAPGEILLCYSDGLVERPGEEMAVGLCELTTVASEAARPGAPSPPSDDLVDRVAQHTVERMTRDGYADDVTVLALRRTGDAAADLAVELPARPDQLGALRGRLLSWLTSVGASDEDVLSINLAVLEAVANAIEHAYPGPGGTVRVEGHVDGGGRACMTVLDHGRWRRPVTHSAGRGRGIAMMRSCMDSVEVERERERAAVAGVPEALAHLVDRADVDRTADDQPPAAGGLDGQCLRRRPAGCDRVVRAEHRLGPQLPVQQHGGAIRAALDLDGVHAAAHHRDAAPAPCRMRRQGAPPAAVQHRHARPAAAVDVALYPDGATGARVGVLDRVRDRLEHGQVDRQHVLFARPDRGEPGQEPAPQRPELVRPRGQLHRQVRGRVAGAPKCQHRDVVGVAVAGHALDGVLGDAVDQVVRRR